jgi:hypothetical protein
MIADRNAFATAAITGIVANPSSGCNSPCDLAHYAFDIADAMMKESVKRATKAQAVAPAEDLV